MLSAVMVTVKSPETPAGRKTLSTLFRWSADPPTMEWLPLKTLPLYVVVPIVTVRSRSLLRAAPVVLPGGSVQARVTRNGLVGSVIVPEKVAVCPVSVNKLAASSSCKMRGTPSKAIPRSSSPMPWLFDHNVSLAPEPVTYRAEFIR